MNASSSQSPFPGSSFIPGAASLLGRNWGYLVLRGVLALILAAVAILFPVGALVAFTLIFAAYAAADGVLSLIAGIRGARNHQERWWTFILRGLIGIAVAILFILAPGVATVSYAFAILFLLAFWAITTGILEVAAAINLRKEIKGEWLLALSGVISILLGIWVLALIWQNPYATILSAAWVIAAWAIIAGISLIVLGLRLKRRQHDA